MTRPSNAPDQVLLNPGILRFRDAIGQLLPRTLLARTFVLVSLLIFVSVATWLTLFSFAQNEPRARQTAQLAVSVVNLTEAALVAADPRKRQALLKDLADSEGVILYPRDPDDVVIDVPDDRFFTDVLAHVRAQLGANARLAASVNGQTALWIGFDIDGLGEDDYWLGLPAERAERDFPWFWVACGTASLVFAVLVAWIVVKRLTRPLAELAASAAAVGRGQHPEPLAEDGATEFAQLASAFNRMSEDLRRINQERAEVLAGISHDLRTPLARLRLEAELSFADDSSREAVIGDIEQMDGIIAQFLDYARGEGSETAEIADANAVVELAIGQAGRQMAIETVLGELPPARIYPKALGRAVGNLLENARKYAGGEILVTTRYVTAEIQIDVCDRGPGIPAHECERVKRAFTRLEGARTDATGTGLGLAIVDRIARLHGGALDLLAREGGGLVARLRIPCA